MSRSGLLNCRPWSLLPCGLSLLLPSAVCLLLPSAVCYKALRLYFATIFSSIPAFCSKLE
jgi:hypothetical protein